MEHYIPIKNLYIEECTTGYQASQSCI